jgi:hypothetical protein
MLCVYRYLFLDVLVVGFIWKSQMKFILFSSFVVEAQNFSFFLLIQMSKQTLTKTRIGIWKKHGNRGRVKH